MGNEEHETIDLERGVFQPEEGAMTTMREEHSRSAFYSGANGDWFIAYAVNRDSDTLERSNFEVMAKALKLLPEVKQWSGEFTPVTIERSSHWACGWVDYLIVNPQCVAAVNAANEMRARIEEYPILDETHFSQLESDEVNEVWANCYNWRERADYIRKHRRQFEFGDWLDLWRCVRGAYFRGDAGELLH